MSEKLKALINSIFVQLNRYDRQQEDFSADTFLRDCESYFSELDRLDLSGGDGMVIDEHLKQRILPSNVKTPSSRRRNCAASPTTVNSSNKQWRR